MIYAQIKDGMVINTIVLDDESLSSLFSKGYDHFIRVDQLNYFPGVDWTYTGSLFLAPVDGE